MHHKKFSASTFAVGFTQLGMHRGHENYTLDFFPFSKIDSLIPENNFFTTIRANKTHQTKQ
jgi:hypothetical protein